MITISHKKGSCFKQFNQQNKPFKTLVIKILQLKQQRNKKAIDGCFEFRSLYESCIKKTLVVFSPC